HLDGYDLPVSTFLDEPLFHGGFKTNVAFEERRNIATLVPNWIKENCIQCNRCSFVCPHATIRPFLISAEEKAKIPAGIEVETIKAIGKGVEGYEFTIQVSQENCVGCGLCAVECPAKEKALVMNDVKEELAKVPESDYVYNNITYKTDFFPINQVKGSQFLRPYFENSGACPGCGETPYYKLMSQLFGKDAMIANATGCSSIYCGSMPSNPFVIDDNGHGPAWGNSLFEDDAEFGFGMRLAQNFKREHIKQIIEDNIKDVEESLKVVLNNYLACANREEEKALKDELVKELKASSNENIKELLDYEGYLVDKSQWMIGGDGWAYDIGYGGLDHVLANNLNVNILVLDTEVYSNTGGQSSKSSQAGSIAKFAASGKEVAKKDLAQIAMTYGHVYVAQVSMGANQAQVIKAMNEAESYDGPSLIIAYSPCIEHGIKGGLMNHQTSQKRAVECGYFNLFRFDPRLEEEGKNPLQVDSKPNFDLFVDFLSSETRFSQLSRINPDNMERLFNKSKADAIKRHNRLMKLAQ
ncbi:MAG: 4Fe-4S binding protein, partial [Bacilli bacterium]|nr:4Fe-4S binding protein [Bacilli bacterium]